MKKSENSIRINDPSNLNNINNSDDSYCSRDEDKNKAKVYKKKENAYIIHIYVLSCSFFYFMECKT